MTHPAPPYAAQRSGVPSEAPGPTIDVRPQRSNWSKVWSLLEPSEKLLAAAVLAITLLTAAGTTLMIASLVAFLSLVSNPDSLRSSFVISALYDTLGFTSTHRFTMFLGGVVMAMIAIGMVLQLARLYSTSYFIMMRIRSLTVRLFRNYLSKEYEFFLGRKSTELSNRVLAEAQEVVLRFIGPCTELATSVTMIVVIMGYLFWSEPVISIFVIVSLGGTFALSYFVSRKRVRELGHIRANRNAERFNLAGEAFSGIKTLKFLGLADTYLSRFDSVSRDMASAEAQGRIMEETPFFLIQTLALMGTVGFCVLLFASTDEGGGNGFGDVLPLLGLFGFAGQRLMPEFGRLYRSISKLQFGGGAVKHVYDDLIDVPPADVLRHTETAPLGLGDALSLQEIGFCYRGAAAQGVDGVDLSIRAGEKIGIVGETGAGKTTLVDVILGLLSPQQGRMIVDGHLIGPENLRAWQATISYVPQEIFLIDASVTDNIAVAARSDAIDPDRLLAAARAAQVDGFVQQLPDGYETFVGERGVRLSGGQRQRIGIARALFSDADLIVFDEATSALDNHTESEVMTAIDAIPKRKTILMIAHRLSTVQKCDRIIVMEKGKVVGFDSWDRLQETCPAFQRIIAKGDSTTEEQG